MNKLFAGRKRGTGENYPMFYSREEESGLILNACEKMLGDVLALNESQAVKLLNFRDDLQSAIDGEEDIEKELLDRVEKLDAVLKSNILFIQSMISFEFVYSMRGVYDESHWWWY
ncbi:MAG: hypothetical protein M1269_04910 [Chloroflexi bacterium]|nr:hypothetical protein [Chloroflexota bacterium]